MNDLLPRAISATSNEWILQWVTSDFLQLPTSTTSNERTFQRVMNDLLPREISGTINESILQRVTSHSLQRVTSGFCNK